MIQCLLCKKFFKQITNQHLKICNNITTKEYKILFPTSELTSSYLKQLNSKQHVGKLLSLDTKKKISESMKGKHHSIETIKKLSEAKKGNKNPSKRIDVKEKLSTSHKGKAGWWKGKKLTFNHKENLKKSWSKERKQYFQQLQKNHFQNKDFLEKWINGSKTTPNKTEIFLINIIQNLNLNFQFVGNYKIWIGGKNPDFINNDSNKIIEFFGYYHRKSSFQQNKKHENERKIHFEKYGYKCLILWDEDLKNIELLKIKLLNFNSD